ncbi:MAG TPA: YceD family protein [Rhizomicrobium sp.]|jgi:hypothetical protein
MNTPPLHLLRNLSELSDAGFETIIRPDEGALRQLAEWLDVIEVVRFEARIDVRPKSKTRFAYEADIDAEIVQNCVVTLEPVHTRIERHVVRALHLAPGLHHPPDKGGILTLTPNDDETSEEIESRDYDLATPLLEEMALAIDPYPRAPGVAFEPPSDGDGAESGPFAALERFKRPS